MTSKIILLLRSCSSFTTAFLTDFLGEFDKQLSALLLFICVNLIISLFVKFFQKELSFIVCCKCFFLHLCIIIIVGMGHLLDKAILEANNLFRTSIIIFYISNMCISILNHMEIIGVPIPQKIKQLITQLGKDET